MTSMIRLQPSWIAPINPRQCVYTDYDLVIEHGRIEALLPRTDADRHYPSAQLLPLPGQVVLPGLVNGHGHAAMTLLRGYADDYSLMEWLENHIWPVEAKFVSETFVATGAWLAAAESVSSGTTCCADSYFFPESTAEAMARVGIRSQITTPIIQFPNAWAGSEDHHIEKSQQFFEWAAAMPRLTFGFAPHSAYSLSDKAFTKTRSLALSNDLPVHLHLHESRDELDRHFTQHGCRPMERMKRLGMYDTQLQTVHMTQLLDHEIEDLTATRTPVVHCPESNMKLASGACPVSELLAQDVVVALGTDGAASNNDLDMFQEMRTAALLAKVTTGNPEALSAEDALHMATLGGAQFLGLDQMIGSLEPGKRADVIAVQLNDIQSQPVYHPVSQLVYTCTGRNVTHTFVDGQLVYEKGRFTQFDEDELKADVATWKSKIGALT